MQLPKQKPIFNIKEVQNILKCENKFISELLSVLPIPIIKSKDEKEEEFLIDSDNDTREDIKHKSSKLKKNRATSLAELQSRFQQMSSKKQLSYKEKLLRKTIRSKIRRKGKQQQDARNVTHKKAQIKKEIKEESTINSTASVNKGGDNLDVNNTKMIFSKIDFTGIGKSKPKKTKLDPQKALENLKKTKEEVQKLEQSGEIAKAVEVNEKTSWSNAFAKSQGLKVKDDENLLAKTIKRKQMKKERSKKKWEAREANVQKMKDDRQKKRQDNIEGKKKAKKVKKMKQASKRGRIIPGF
ncbi:hypothetical protein FQA39_LY08270 [Lamprigera yunnana]|nr:hypothetical protein FQA39_LY08270 [Lamprigera yunnana]